MDKSLRLYALCMVIVFLFLGAVYGVADRISGRMRSKIEIKDTRIRELEAKLSRCVEMSPEITDCAGAIQEAEFWRELAEDCVDRKATAKEP